MRRLLAALLVVTVGCAAGDSDDDAAPPPSAPATVAVRDFPPAPVAPDGPADAATDAWREVLLALERGLVSVDDLREFGEVGDVRHAWLVADRLRFAPPGPETDALTDAFEQLTGTDLGELAADAPSPWNSATDLMIAWDTPAPPDFRELKGSLYALVEQQWAPFFADPEATFDDRWISWGGVFIDDRPLGDDDPCGGRGCIPALDDPELVPADEGDWYPDEAIVFGIAIGDEAVALPKNIMQVHEMVNITVGGARLGIPYCTLCGSAQAFRTADVPDDVETPILRTSGLLSRSNKVMFDLNTFSAFDTFTGEAVSGPLRERGVVLDQETVSVSTWGDWKAEHPGTTIIAEDGGIGRSYDADPLGGRDDDGPIFPIGDVDPRLAVQAAVVGVVLDDGTPIAFPADPARDTLAEGDPVQLGEVELAAAGSGFTATVDGDPIAAHEAFWFAWSQFHPDTLLWPNDV